MLNNSFLSSRTINKGNMFDYDLDKDHTLTDGVKEEIRKAALEAYPVHMSEYSDSCRPYDANESDRLVFIEGYAQCYKDYTYSIQKKIEEIRYKQTDYDIAISSEAPEQTATEEE